LYPPGERLPTIAQQSHFPGFNLKRFPIAQINADILNTTHSCFSFFLLEGRRAEFQETFVAELRHRSSSFFNNEIHEMARKNSWQVHFMPAVSATPMNFFVPFREFRC